MKKLSLQRYRVTVLLPLPQEVEQLPLSLQDRRGQDTAGERLQLRGPSFALLPFIRKHGAKYIIRTKFKTSTKLQSWERCQSLHDLECAPKPRNVHCSPLFSCHLEGSQVDSLTQHWAPFCNPQGNLKRAEQCGACKALLDIFEPGLACCKRRLHPLSPSMPGRRVPRPPSPASRLRKVTEGKTHLSGI